MRAMHPDLLNNSLFLRYYSQWQKNPDSVVFASIADYFLRYGLIDDALKICKEGLRRNPKLIIGHIVMAKIHFARGNLEEAEEELRSVIQTTPKNIQAQGLLAKIDEARMNDLHRTAVEAPKPGGTREADMPSEWETVTMARIFAQQGHRDRAREIYYSILEKDPQNEDAHRGLAAINS